MTRKEATETLARVTAKLRAIDHENLANDLQAVLSVLQDNDATLIALAKQQADATAAARYLGSLPPKQGKRPRGRPPVKRQGA